MKKIKKLSKGKPMVILFVENGASAGCCPANGSTNGCCPR